MTAAAERRAGVTLGPAGGNPRSLYREAVATRFAPALPGLAIATVQMVATRFAPALPGLAIATSGNLDFSSCVNIGEGPGRQGR
ncbi:hypothetical protein A5702_00220 [Mycobacterium sp. E3339]|nr:hypothetical protein A5702_00220 [Mycobacterium sp. E3339]